MQKPVVSAEVRRRAFRANEAELSQQRHGSGPHHFRLHSAGWVLSILLLAAVVPLAAEDESERRYSERQRHFGLYNHCQPVRVVVENLPDAASEIDLTRQRITDLVEVRLRGARLYRGVPGLGLYDDAIEPGPYLYVQIALHKTPRDKGASFSTTLEYSKPVTDTWATQMKGIAPTWRTGNVGYGDGDYIVNALSERLDAFILQYLHVNEDACDPVPPRVSER